MSEAGARKEKPHRRRKERGDPRFQVYGLWMVVRMNGPQTAPYAVQCPHGQAIQYGTVVSKGDGFDSDAATFRNMPPLGAVVAFEETPESIEGHYFFAKDIEHRIVHLDVVNIAFPPRE